MELELPTNALNKIYKFKLDIEQNRNDERVPAVYAYKNLLRPDLVVRFDRDINSYIVIFRGLWRRINLEINYFSSLESLVRKRGDEVNVETITAEAKRQLGPIVEIMNYALDEVTPIVSKDFSSIGFWEGIKLMLENSGIRPINMIQASFNLDPLVSEVSVLVNHYSNFNIISIGGYDAIYLKSQTSVYYTNISRLLVNKDFRLAKYFENKSVCWFLNNSLSYSDLEFILRNDNLNQFDFVAFHPDQTLSWVHLFIYDNIQSYEYAILHNAYDNWRMLYSILENQIMTHKRVSYTLTGNYYSDLSILGGIFGACIYPKNFLPSTFGNYNTMYKAIKDYEHSMSELSLIHSIKQRSKSFYQGFIGEHMNNYGDQDLSSYYVINWRGVVYIDSGNHLGDSSSKNMIIAALPNPLNKIDPFLLTNVIEVTTVHNAFNWSISSKSLFNALYLQIYDDIHSEFAMDLEYDFQVYRTEWNQFRLETKVPIIKATKIDQSNVDTLLTIDADVGIPVIYKVLEEVSSQESGARLQWNNSTIKILSIINSLFTMGILDSSTPSPYTIQFFGVITEPVQFLLQLSSVKNLFRVIQGVGAQATSGGLRSGIEQYLNNNSPYVAFSDIDQSESLNEEDAANSLLDHLLRLISIANVVVIKIMYTTPRVLHRVSVNVKELKVVKAYFVKPCASGPFSLESYMVVQRGRVAENINHINFKNVESWILDRMFLLERFIPNARLFRPILINGSEHLMRMINSPNHFYFAFRAHDQNSYRIALSAASAMSERVYVTSIGTTNIYELIIYGERWRKRSSLTMRVGSVSAIDIPQGGTIYPRSGPQIRNQLLPIRFQQGFGLDEDGNYNLAIKRRMFTYLTNEIERRGIILPNVIDVGGRSSEAVSFIGYNWNYTTLDKALLPDFMKEYNVHQIVDYTDWKDASVFEPFNIVLVTFSLMVDGAQVEVLRERVKFLKSLSDMGKIVIFNFYALNNIRRIVENRHRSISVSEDRTRGSFGNYREQPYLMDIQDDVFKDIIINLRISVLDVLSSMLQYGLAVNPELLTWLDDFNDFCPLVTFK